MQIFYFYFGGYEESKSNKIEVMFVCMLVCVGDICQANNHNEIR